MRRFWLATAAALITTSAIAGPVIPASASPCVDGNAGTGDYTATGSCTVGGLTFSDFSTPSVTNAVLSTPSITPYAVGGEDGLTLNFTTLDPTKTTDVSWKFDV
jgi:hypothetical protein